MKMKTSIADLSQQVDLNKQQIADKEQAIQRLSLSREELEKSLEGKEGYCSGLESKLSILSDELETKEKVWAETESQQLLRLQELEQKTDSHLALCQGAVVAQVSQLKMELEASQRENQVEKQVLKLKVAEMTTLVAEHVEQVRLMRAETGKIIS